MLAELSSYFLYVGRETIHSMIADAIHDPVKAAIIILLTAISIPWYCAVNAALIELRGKK